MDDAHKSCRYSKALRGDTTVTLVLDQQEGDSARDARKRLMQIDSERTKNKSA